MNPSDKREIETSSDEDAVYVASALAAIQGKVDVPPGIEPLVYRGRDYSVVTFPTNLREGMPGADYHARVILDTRTGRVVDIQGG
jgi:hypothetical protein